jgi:digalactosyldiacylglycerol synthase
VNPSISEVLCTTVIEALAMGKWVVCPRHPSNEFFYQFPNCLTYETAEEFAANVYWALSTDPRPLSPELRYELTWEAATERLIQACMITTEMAANAKVVSDKIALWVHDVVSGSAAGDVLRKLGGGRKASGQLDFIKKYATSEPRSVNDLSTLEGEEGEGELSGLDTSVHGTPVVLADGATSKSSLHEGVEGALTF